MTIEQFGQTIKAKYPEYSKYSDIEVGQKMLQKYPEYQSRIDQPEQPKFESGFGGSKFIGSALGTLAEAPGLLQSSKAGAGQAEIIKQRVAQGKLTPERANQLLKGLQPTMQNTGYVKPTGKQLLGTAVETGTTVASPFLGVPSTAVGRIFGLGGGLGAASGLAKGLEQNKSAGGIAGSTALGYGVGAATAGALEGISQLVTKGIPALLRKTSGQPKALTDINMDNPEFKFFGKNPGTKEALDNVQKVQGEARKDLSKFYQTKGDELAQEFSGQRIGLNETQAKKLMKVVDSFDLEDIPQNPQSFSLKEGLKLLKQLNSVQPDVSKGIDNDARRLFDAKNELRDLLKTSFGEDSPVTSFLSEYGQRKAILDASNDIVKLHLAAKPTSQVSSMNRIMRTFKESTGEEFTTALQNLQDQTGKNVLNKIAAATSSKIQPGGGIQGALKDIALPLTSPRLAMGEIQLLHSLDNLIQKSGLNQLIRILASKESGKVF